MLHEFTDSSEEAYEAVGYLRSKKLSSGNINMSLVASKAKVAPLKSISLPRLELTAAVLGVGLDSKMCNALTLET